MNVRTTLSRIRCNKWFLIEKSEKTRDTLKARKFVEKKRRMKVGKWVRILNSSEKTGKLGKINEKKNEGVLRVRTGKRQVWPPLYRLSQPGFTLRCLEVVFILCERYLCFGIRRVLYIVSDQWDLLYGQSRILSHPTRADFVYILGWCMSCLPLFDVENVWLCAGPGRAGTGLEAGVEFWAAGP